MFPGQPNVPYTLIYCKALINITAMKAPRQCANPGSNMSPGGASPEQYEPLRSYTPTNLYCPWSRDQVHRFQTDTRVHNLLWTSHGICAGLNQYPSVRKRLKSTRWGQILHLLVWRPRGALKHINYTLLHHKCSLTKILINEEKTTLNGAFAQNKWRFHTVSDAHQMN